MLRPHSQAKGKGRAIRANVAVPRNVPKGLIGKNLQTTGAGPSIWKAAALRPKPERNVPATIYARSQGVRNPIVCSRHKITNGKGRLSFGAVKGPK